MKYAVCLTFLLLALLFTPAMADEVYDNGPTNGNVYAWTINFGFAVSDTFYISNRFESIDGLAFAVWLFPGDANLSAEVSITSAEFGGTTYFDQVLNFSQGSCFGNAFGFNVCTETADLGNEHDLDPGTYWLNLQNASVNTGDPVYWDENSGPALASENSIGTIPSESFTILGTRTTSCMPCGCSDNPNCGPPSPEPGSILLFGSGVVAMFGSGILGLLGGLWRKLF